MAQEKNQRILELEEDLALLESQQAAMATAAQVQEEEVGIFANVDYHFAQGATERQPGVVREQVYACILYVTLVHISGCCTVIVQGYCSVQHRKTLCARLKHNCRVASL